MAKTKQKILALAIACVCALSLLALAACSQNNAKSSSSSSDEKFSSEPTEQTSVSTDPFYVLVIGNDTRIGTSGIDDPAYSDGSARSDTMMLVRVDPMNYQLSLVSIPRDTQDVVYGRTAKINESYEEGGAEELIDHVEALTGVRAKYYLDSTFVQFQELVNKLGGIHVYVPIDQKMTDIVSGKKISFPAGEQDLNGAEALIFARERHKYDPYGEVYRQTNDRYIVETMIEAILSDPATAVSVAKDLASGIETNWPTDELALYVQDFLEHADEITFISGTGPYLGDTDPASGMWLTTRDEATWAEIMAVVDAGGDPNTIIESLSAL